jgi:diamine N-acetyltransferase
MRLSNLFDHLSNDDITIRRAEKADVLPLQGICDAWIERSFFEGETLAFDHIERCLNEGDLPPIADPLKENYVLFVVEKSKSIIGLFDLYDGYPETNTAWIGLFLLDIEFRNEGYGKLICEMIASSCQQDGIESMALAVSMNNRLAFKFWINQGFKEILGLYGNIKYPIIGLKRTL